MRKMDAMHTTPLTEYRTAASVCKEYGCDRSTLSRWVKEGFIAPAMQMPGSRGAFLFDPAEVARVKPAATERLAARRGAVA